MRITIWLLRALAVITFALLIFPTGFDIFLANGGDLIWTTTYVYLIALLVAAYGLKLAFMSDPQKWHKVLGFALVMPLLVLILLIEVIGAHDI